MLRTTANTLMWKSMSVISQYAQLYLLVYFLSYQASRYKKSTGDNDDVREKVLCFRVCCECNVVGVCVKCLWWHILKCKLWRKITFLDLHLRDYLISSAILPDTQCDCLFSICSTLVSLSWWYQWEIDSWSVRYFLYSRRKLGHTDTNDSLPAYRNTHNRSFNV